MAHKLRRRHFSLISCILSHSKLRQVVQKNVCLCCYVVSKDPFKLDLDSVQSEGINAGSPMEA